MEKKDERPVNLDLMTVEFPLAALASFTHRVTGVAIVPGIALLLYLLQLSLSSETGFNTVKNYLDNIFLKIFLWLILSSIGYHSIAGVKHLVMDFGVGESLKGGQLAAKIVVFSSIILSIAIGIRLF